MKTMSEEHRNDCCGSVMSNCDGLVEDGADKILKSRKCHGEYPEWNFFGHVWWENELFHCEVMCYGSHVQTISAGTLKELMADISDEYGWQ